MLKVSQVLVPTDFSDNCLAALEYGVALVREARGCLHLLHVVDASVFGPPYIPQGGFVYPKDQVETLQQLAALRHQYADIEVETVGLVGTPAQEIVTYASQHRIDLICLATHGRRGLARALLGSTAEAVVRTAPCPVLTVRGLGHEPALPLNDTQRQEPRPPGR
jgi:universal stress protein A